MSHLDEGTLAAMLDGEIDSESLVPITAHLHGCAACRAHLEELRAMATEAETLVTSLGDGSSTAPTPIPVAPLRARPRTRLYRQLAWAASILLAWGIGSRTRGGEGTPAAVLIDSPPAVPVAPAAALRDEASPPLARPAIEDPEAGLAPERRRSTSEAGTPATPAPAAAQPERTAASAPPVERVVPSVRTDLGAARSVDSRTLEQIGALQGKVAGASSQLRELPRPATPQLAESALDRQEVALESFAPIDFVEAVARMGGTLRLIDGLVPDRLEASPMSVRVIYLLVSGELVLEQRRQGDSVQVALRGPLSSDSLAVLRRRVR